MFPETLTAEQEREAFDVTPWGVGLSSLIEPDSAAAEAERVHEVQESLKDWAEDTGNTESIYPWFKEQFSACVARSRQCDSAISDYGEIGVEMSLEYTEQSIALWHQMRRAAEKEAGDENNH